MPNAAKPGLATLLAHPEDAPEAVFELGRGVGNRATLSGGPPALNARLGKPSIGHTPALGRSGALRRPGTTPRPDRDGSDRPSGTPSSARPSSAPLQRRSETPATSPRSAVQQQPRGRARQRPGSPAGPVAARSATARPRGSAPRATRRHPTRRAIFTKRLGTAPLAESRRHALETQAPGGTPLPCSRPPAA